MGTPKQQPTKQPRYFEAAISQFDGIRPTPLKVTPTVSQAVEYIRSDNRLRTDIEEARRYLRQELAENARDQKTGKLLLPEYENVKKELPAVIWTGTFKHRSNSGLLIPSGFLSFDIDFIDKKTDKVQSYDALTEQAAEAYNQIAQDQYTSFVFPSVSATGVKGLVKIPYADNDADYKAYFRAYQEYALRELGQTLDSLPDISRLCFLAYHKTAHENRDALIFDRRIAAKEEAPASPKQEGNTPSDVSLRAAIDVLMRHGIGEIDRNNFVGFCGAFKTAGVTYDVFDQIMQRSPGYDAGNNFKIWNTVKDETYNGKPATAASIIHKAREIDKPLFVALRKSYLQAGESASGEKGLATLIENKLATRYTFRLNTLTDKIIVVTGKETRPMTDFIESEIRCWLVDNGFNKRDTVSDVLRVAAYKNQFHPVEQYLRGLEYKGQSQLAKMGKYFHDRDKIFVIVFTAWGAATIRRTLTGQHHQCLIFAGKQGRGKSFFTKWLCSSLPDYHIESPVDPDTNDARIRVTEKWIWEIGEINGTMRKADIEALKLFISQEGPVYRRAHDKHDQKKRALASFVGTVNPDGSGFLNDPTGNRRWWPIELQDINFAYTQHIDVDQLWAELFQLYQADPVGSCLIPDKVQSIINTNIDNEFCVPDPVEEMILSEFEFTFSTDDFMDTNQIIRALQQSGYQRKNQQADAMFVAKAMKKIIDSGEYGVEKGREHGTRGNRGYFGIRSKSRVLDDWSQQR